MQYLKAQNRSKQNENVESVTTASRHNTVQRPTTDTKNISGRGRGTRIELIHGGTTVGGNNYFIFHLKQL